MCVFEKLFKILQVEIRLVHLLVVYSASVSVSFCVLRIVLVIFM